MRTRVSSLIYKSSKGENINFQFIDSQMINCESTEGSLLMTNAELLNLTVKGSII